MFGVCKRDLNTFEVVVDLIFFFLILYFLSEVNVYIYMCREKGIKKSSIGYVGYL